MMHARYPLDDLARAAHITLGQPGRPDRSPNTTGGDPLTGIALLAARLDVSTSTVKRARRTGLDDHRADTWALALGLLPHQVWPTWWANALTDDDLDEIVSHQRRLRWRHHTRTVLRCRHRPTHTLQAAA